MFMFNHLVGSIRGYKMFVNHFSFDGHLLRIVNFLKLLNSQPEIKILVTELARKKRSEQ